MIADPGPAVREVVVANKWHVRLRRWRDKWGVRLTRTGFALGPLEVWRQQ